MLSLHWGNALKIYLWKLVSLLQEAIEAGVPYPESTRSSALLAIDVVRRHYGTFGSLVQECTQAYALLDTDAQMMLYYLVLHSTLGTFHLLDALDELRTINPHWDPLMDPVERTTIIQVSTGFVANISSAMRRLTRDDATTQRSKLEPTVHHPLAPHFTPSEAPRIWNHPLLNMALDAFLSASLFSARVLANQMGIVSRVPPTTHATLSTSFRSPLAPSTQHPSSCSESAGLDDSDLHAHLTVFRTEAAATRAKLRACAAALHDLTGHLPSLLSWHNAKRVKAVQDEVQRLERVWNRLTPPPAPVAVPTATATATTNPAPSTAHPTSTSTMGTATMGDPNWYLFSQQQTNSSFSSSSYPDQGSWTSSSPSHGGGSPSAVGSSIRPTSRAHSPQPPRGHPTDALMGMAR